MDTPITRAEHEEFRRRIEEENKRQDKRIELLEGTTTEIHDLATSVAKMAVSMENMLTEQKQQGARLETLESRDGEMWRKVTGYVLTAIIGIAVGYIFTQIGMR